MTVFFTGWLAEGTGAAGAFVENAASGYARQPVTMAAIFNGSTALVSGVTFSGTSAPFIVTQRAFYDAVSGGNLLQWWNLRNPVSVAAGGTNTLAAGKLAFFYPALNPTMPTNQVIYAAGSIIGTTDDGNPIYAGPALSFYLGNS